MAPDKADGRWARPGSRERATHPSADDDRARRRIPAPGVATLALLLAVLVAGALLGRAAHAVRPLAADVSALRADIAAQGAAMERLATAGDLQALSVELYAGRAALSRVVPNDAKVVTARFVKTPRAAIGPPIYAFRDEHIELPLYVQFCAEYELAGGVIESCMGVADYDAAVRCHERIVVGRALPECFR